MSEWCKRSKTCSIWTLHEQEVDDKLLLTPTLYFILLCIQPNKGKCQTINSLAKRETTQLSKFNPLIYHFMYQQFSFCCFCRIMCGYTTVAYYSSRCRCDSNKHRRNVLIECQEVFFFLWVLLLCTMAHRSTCNIYVKNYA